MTFDLFDPLIKTQGVRLEKLGNPLVALNEVIDWEGFRPNLEHIHTKKCKSKAQGCDVDVKNIYLAKYLWFDRWTT